MDSETVGTLAEFVTAVEGLAGGNDLLLFRGQPVKGNLIPRIARKEPTRHTLEKERKLLHQLRRLGAALLPSPEPDDWDLLVMAQHFGMATRLLDWTSNPLAGLWFACSDRTGADAYVYALRADSLLIEDISGGPFATAKTRVFQPRLNNPRIVAQHGWFTAHRFSNSAKRWVALNANPEVAKHLTEFRVPEASKPEMLRALNRHGVSSRTLFPDLEGLCSYLDWKHETA